MDSNTTQKQQRSVLITGCSTGIGLVTAQVLQQHGYQVLTTARHPKDIDRLRRTGFECRFMDYAQEQSVSETVQWAYELGKGKLYGLFNNGAYGQPGAVEDLTRDVLREQFESNFFGWHQMTCEVLARMREVNEGRIIHNSSVLGLVAMKFRGAYNASKFALEGLTDTMRLELRGSNIHVVLVEPGPIYSEFRNNAYAAFKKNIKPFGSFHAKTYEQLESRLATTGTDADSTFTLGPEAVAKKVLKALEHPNPAARYPVTFPTYLFSYLRAFLPTKMLDALLNKAG